MSVVGNNRVGIPIVVLHDAEGAVIEVETKTGELIRGLLFEAEDQMNLYIKNAVIQDTNGVKRKANQVYLRGTEIVFIVLPDMLKHAPMFNRIKHWRKHGGAPPEGVGQAVGQAAAILRKAQERRRGGFGGRFGGRGRDGGRGFGGRGVGRGGGRVAFGRGPPPDRGPHGAPGQYGPR
ncbi:LSM domain containing protein [Nitzschia inconspicua]|uniref:Small nuclear ribonucleoprotein Sm D3 n=1 Tax=Nitzschia inconspicua TaxID=303405 RepID=A0A9K3PEX8_9STRA|nr:LSM domain containing protein [Nitzschia inconspicua]KAG7370132.1 LSM domain containing protein [Nitzschia inconspicua]